MIDPEMKATEILKGIEFYEDMEAYLTEKIIAALRQARLEALEEAAKIAKNIFGGPSKKFDSESYDLYLAQDHVCEQIAAAIRSAGQGKG